MTRWRNDNTHWGLLAIILHWLVAVVVVGLFGLGWWMTDLSYYDEWYRLGPFWHKSIGLTLLLVLLLRLVWRFINPPPAPLSSHSLWQQRLAHGAQLFLYLLLFISLISGYLISTADGRPIAWFGWFDVPALELGIEQQEELAGSIHWYGALALMGLAALHSLAALKHHWIDKDQTLVRMLKPAPKTFDE